MFQRSEITSRFNPVLLSAILVAGLIPLYKKLVPAAIILLFISSLVTYKQSRIAFKFSLPLVSLGLLYMLYVVGMIFTTDTNEGWFTLELKLSMLVMPLYFLFFRPFTQVQLHIILLIFVLACVACSIIGFISAFTNYRTDGDTDWFFSAKISYLIHPTYMAMYACTAMLCLAAWLIQGWKKLSILLRIVFILLLPYFSVYILLLASKGGIISLGVVWIAIVMYWFYHIGLWYMGIAAVALFLSGLVYMIKYPTVTRWKFEKATEIYYMPIDSVLMQYKTTSESNAVRRMVWHVAWEKVKDNPWGDGTGDAQNNLHAEFKRRGITGAYERRLNCHNQYLETAITLGIAGLLVFMVFLFSGLWHGITHRKFVLVWLLLVAMINMLFESMLETQTGVVFLCYFISTLVASPGNPRGANHTLNS